MWRQSPNPPSWAVVALLASPVARWHTREVTTNTGCEKSGDRVCLFLIIQCAWQCLQLARKTCSCSLEAACLCPCGVPRCRLWRTHIMLGSKGVQLRGAQDPAVFHSLPISSAVVWGFTFPGLLSGKANSPTMNSIIFLIPKHCVLCFICLVASFLSKCPLREWDTFSSLEFGDEKHSSAPHPVPTAFEERVMFDTERHQWAKPHLTFVVWIQHWNQTKPVFLVFFPFFFFWSEWH